MFPLFTLLSSLALAGDDLMTPLGQGMGGAVVANSWDNSASMVNPAAPGLAEHFDVHAHAAIGEQTELAASAVDASGNSSNLVLGMAFRRTIAEPEYTDDDLPGWYVSDLPSNVKRYTEVQVGGAYPFMDNTFSVGIGGTVAHYANDRQGKGWSANVDIGLAGRPVPWLSMGLVGRNLVPFSGPRPTPLGALAGIRIEGMDLGGVEVDGGFTYEDGELVPDLRAGGEVSIEIVQVVAGFSYTKAPAIHGGLGIVNENGGLTYGIRAPLDGTPLLHTLGLVVYTMANPRP